ADGGRSEDPVCVRDVAARRTGAEPLEHRTLTDDSPHPRHASRAASYAASVFAAMAGQVNRSRIRARPARPIAVARAGSASHTRGAAPRSASYPLYRSFLPTNKTVAASGARSGMGAAMIGPTPVANARPTPRARYHSASHLVSPMTASSRRYRAMSEAEVPEN